MLTLLQCYILQGGTIVEWSIIIRGEGYEGQRWRSAGVCVWVCEIVPTVNPPMHMTGVHMTADTHSLPLSLIDLLYWTKGSAMDNGSGVSRSQRKKEKRTSAA